MSDIEWTDETWNPTTGCTKVSQGCKNCYAEIMTRRLKAMGQSKYQAGFNQVIEHWNELRRPYQWKKPRRVFVNSMSDLFHVDVSTEFILQVFKTMNSNQKHQFQILTKRPERVHLMNDILDWSENIWMGTSIENQDNIDRLHSLVLTDARIKFLSCEPLLGPLDFSVFPFDWSKHIDWVIVGGESVSGRSHDRLREIHPDWVRSIRDQCIDRDVKFFFKQWGGINKKKSGRKLDGREWNEFPIELEEYF